MPSAAHQGATYEGDTTTTMTGGAVVAAMHMAGWPRSQWRTLAAVAYQESSWRSGITYRLADGRGMRGIMQINDDAHPEKIATGNWRNPVDNFKMALKIYREAGNSWRPWEGFTDGNYRRYLSKADQAITEHAMAHRSAGQADTEASSVDMTLLEGTGVTITPVSNNSGAVNRLAAAVHWMTQPNTWIRIGMFVAGALLLIIGLLWLVRSSAPVNKLAKQVNSVVSEIVPVGKITKLGKGKKGGKKNGEKSDTSDGTDESS